MPYSEPFQATSPEHRQHFNSPRLAGVEWEFNHAMTYSSIEAWCAKWRGVKKSDGSCGLEMMTAPMAGDHISKCLQELGSAFQQDKASVDKRCGLHVHVNCIDYAWEDIYRLMWIYSKLEDVLFQLGGAWRKTCHYSPPIGARYRTAVGRRFEPNAADLSHPTPQTVQPWAARYALNISPWMYAKQNNSTIKTTVEFRMHENTNDAERVIGWTQLMVEIIDWVKKSNDLQASQLPKNPVRALCKMAPQSRKWIIKQLRGNKRHRPKHHTFNSVVLHYMST